MLEMEEQEFLQLIQETFAEQHPDAMTNRVWSPQALRVPTLPSYSYILTDGSQAWSSSSKMDSEDGIIGEDEVKKATMSDGALKFSL